MANRITPQQTKFIDGYLIHGNGSRAAIEAGYSVSYAGSVTTRLLRKPHIESEIVRRQSLLDSRTVMSVDDWRQQVVGMIDAAEAHHSYGAAMKGIEMLGRHIGALGTGSGSQSLTQEFFSFLRTHAEPDLALESSEDTIDTTIADGDGAIADDSAKGGV